MAKREACPKHKESVCSTPDKAGRGNSLFCGYTARVSSSISSPATPSKGSSQLGLLNRVIGTQALPYNGFVLSSEQSGNLFLSEVRAAQGMGVGQQFQSGGVQMLV